MNGLCNFAHASRLSCDFFNCHTKITTRLKEQRYAEIFQQNLQLLTSSYRALRISGIQWRFRAKCLEFSLEVGAFFGALALGNYCEQGDITSAFCKTSRKIARQLHYLALIISVVALGILAFNGSWVKLTAVGMTLAIQFLNNAIGLISSEKLDFILRVSQFAAQSLGDPLSLANVFTFQLLLDLAAGYCTSSIIKHHIGASLKFSSLKTSDDESDALSANLPEQLVSDCLGLDDIDQIYSKLQVDKRHIRPYLPELEQPSSDITELIGIFDSIDWWRHKEAVIAKLHADRFWTLKTIDAQKPSESLKLENATPEQFYQSDEWAHVSNGFRDLIRAIADNQLPEISQDTQAEALHNCRYILQKIGPLRTSTSVELADILLHLAVEASSSCGSNCMVAIRQVFQTLDSGQEQLLEQGVARLLCREREGLFLKYYSYLASEHKSYLADLMGSFKGTQVYNFFRSMAVLNWGLNAEGCFEELLSCSRLGLLLLLGISRVPSGIILDFVYTPEALIDIVADGFKRGELSTVKLFEWLRQAAEKWGGEKSQEHVEKLAQTNPKFFQIPVFLKSRDPLVSGKIDERILVLFLLDLGVLKCLC